MITTIYLNISVSLFIFIFGLIFGSFLNAWEYRLEHKMSLRGRSLCPACKKRIAWYDNIPLLSWVLLRGKCRHCHKPISAQYPLVELLVGFVFLGLWIYSPQGIVLNSVLNSIFNYQYTNLQLPIRELVQYLLLNAIFLLLILVGLHDAKTKYVLTKHTYVATGLGIFYTALNFRGSLNITDIYHFAFPYLLAAIIPAGLFWLMAKFSKEKAMGAGDADIALAIGFLLGWPKIIPAYYLAFIPAALYGGALLLLKKGHLKSEVPFGPFLITGGFLAILYGQQIFDWYGKIFLGI